MRKILAIIIIFNFCLITSSKTNEIKDFQIEGISLGDSLLKFFSEKEIKKKQSFIYQKDNKNFSKDVAVIQYLDNLKTYDQIQLSFKVKESKYPIVGISAWINFQDNFDACYKKQDEIFNDLNDFFGDVSTKKSGMEDHPGYPKGEVKFKRYSFYLSKKKRSNLEIICITAINYKDRLSVTMKTDEYNKFLLKINK